MDETEIVATLSMPTIVSPSVTTVPPQVPLSLLLSDTAEVVSQRVVPPTKPKRTKTKDATDPSSFPTS